MHKSAHYPKEKSNARYLGPICSAGAALSAAVVFSAFKGIGIQTVISKPKYFFRSEFWQPEWLMAANGGFALRASKESFSYWKALKQEGYSDAAKKARNAFFCDMMNAVVSFAPAVEWILKTNKQSASYSLCASPLAVPLAVLATKQLEKAQELKAIGHKERTLSRQIKEGRVPPSLAIVSTYGELKEKYSENKENMHKKELKELLEFVLQDLNKAYAPNQISQPAEYKILDGWATEISELISSKGEK